MLPNRYLRSLFKVLLEYGVSPKACYFITMSLFYITEGTACSPAKPRPSRVVKAAAEAWCSADYNRESLHIALLTVFGCILS